MRRLIAFIGGLAQPFFKLAERAAILGALKAAAFDLPATKGQPLIVISFIAGIIVLSAWITEGAMKRAMTPPPPAPANLGPKAYASANAVALLITMALIAGTAVVAVSAVVNAIVAATVK